MLPARKCPSSKYFSASATVIFPRGFSSGFPKLMSVE